MLTNHLYHGAARVPEHYLITLDYMHYITKVY